MSEPTYCVNCGWEGPGLPEGALACCPESNPRTAKELIADLELTAKRYHLLMTACGEVVGEMRTYAAKRHGWAMMRLDIAMREADELKAV